MTGVAIPNVRAERLLIIAGRALAVAGVALGVVPCFIVFYEFDNGDKVFDDPIWVRIALCLLQIVPLPIAWWIGRSIARTTAAFAVLVAGMALALVFEVHIYWNVFPLNIGAPLAVISVPALQLLFLALIVLLAWSTGGWISWRSSHRSSAGGHRRNKAAGAPSSMSVQPRRSRSAERRQFSPP
jgi:hypothetical protein